MRSILPLLLITAAFAQAAASPETLKAFDSYIAKKEEAMTARDKSTKFLRLDDHPREKSMVWLNQNFIAQQSVADVQIPEGAVQDWIAEVFFPGVTLEKVRDTLLDFEDYKYWFTPDIVESKLLKREGGDFDSLLRIHRRQIQAVTLNVKSRAHYSEVDSNRSTIAMHSTEVREVRKDGQEVAVEDEHGFLWRMNIYWRLHAADDGVYAELELITLSRSQGRFASEKVLRGFVDSFPRGFTELLSEKARTTLKPPKQSK